MVYVSKYSVITHKHLAQPIVIDTVVDMCEYCSTIYAAPHHVKYIR